MLVVSHDPIDAKIWLAILDMSERSSMSSSIAWGSRSTSWLNPLIMEFVRLVRRWKDRLLLRLVSELNLTMRRFLLPSSCTYDKGLLTTDW